MAYIVAPLRKKETKYNVAMNGADNPLQNENEVPRELADLNLKQILFFKLHLFQMAL